MNKKLFKLGALTLGLFATVILVNTTNAQLTGDVSLTINTGTADCTYLTTMDITGQAAQSVSSYTFTGDFTGAAIWNCKDLRGSTPWSMTLQVSDLNNGAPGNIIPGTGVSLTNTLPTLDAGTSAAGCTGYTGTGDLSSAAYTIMEKKGTTADICEMTVSKVSLSIFVPQYQAPGKYTGTFTVTLNDINSR